LNHYSLNQEIFQNLKNMKNYTKTILSLALLTSGLGACKKDQSVQTSLNDEGPTVTIVSPIKDATVIRGEGKIGAGSFNGTNFVIDLETVTHDTVGVVTNESLNIRNTALLGQINPNFPGLTVSLDADLIKPDGTTIPKGTNLANLFNVAGTDDTPGKGVTVWTSWHVLESFPAGVTQVTLAVSVKDKAGRIGKDSKTFPISDQYTSGQALTPLPLAVAPGDGIDDADGPVVTMIAPRVPSSIATGPQTGLPVPPTNASLFFVQVSALDNSGNGIGVNENADGNPDATRGTIVDGTQSSKGPNRFVTGLNVTFDVDLLQPNGNVIKAGQNLAPVFNTAGSELDPSGYVRSTFGWVVGGSLIMPAGKTKVIIKAQVTDNKGKSGSVTNTVDISNVVNGQALTPNS
jgi:hypothetical protein